MVRMEYMGLTGNCSPKSWLKECCSGAAQPAAKMAMAALMASNHGVQRSWIIFFIKCCLMLNAMRFYRGGVGSLKTHKENVWPVSISRCPHVPQNLFQKP